MQCTVSRMNLYNTAQQDWPKKRWTALPSLTAASSSCSWLPAKQARRNVARSVICASSCLSCESALGSAPFAKTDEKAGADAKMDDCRTRTFSAGCSCQYRPRLRWSGLTLYRRLKELLHELVRIGARTLAIAARFADVCPVLRMLRQIHFQPQKHA